MVKSFVISQNSTRWLGLVNVRGVLPPPTEFQDIAKEFKFVHPDHAKAFAVIIHRCKDMKEWFVIMDTLNPSIGSSRHQIELFITTDNKFLNISSNLNKRNVLLKNATWFQAKELFDKIVENKDEQIFRQLCEVQDSQDEQFSCKDEKEELMANKYIQIWVYNLEDSLTEAKFHAEMMYHSHKNNQLTEIQKAVIELENAILEEADSRGVNATLSLHNPTL